MAVRGLRQDKTEDREVGDQKSEVSKGKKQDKVSGFSVQEKRGYGEWGTLVRSVLYDECQMAQGKERRRKKKQNTGDRRRRLEEGSARSEELRAPVK
jgi:hypothetical protein